MASLNRLLPNIYFRLGQILDIALDIQARIIYMKKPANYTRSLPEPVHHGSVNLSELRQAKTLLQRLLHAHWIAEGLDPAVEEEKLKADIKERYHQHRG